jgi:hypothetical protein
VGHEDGDIPQNLNAPLPGVLAHFAPLGEEQVLAELVKAEIVGELLLGLPEGVRVAMSKRFGPTGPVAVGQVVAQRQEQREVVQPSGVLRAEVPEHLPLGGGPSLKISPGVAQETASPGAHTFEIDPIGPPHRSRR